MKRIILPLILITVSIGFAQCTSGSTGSAPGETDYVLVWADEFEVDGPPCSDNWFHQTQLPLGGSWYNGEVQHYTNRLDNSFVSGGNLSIVAMKETFTDQGETKNYTSARLNSKYAFTYGKVQVRAKLPTGIGTWPAIWMLGKNINEDGGFWDPTYGTVAWPACGEIDIMEHWGNNQNYVQSAMHTPSSFGGTVNLGGQTIATASTEFHIYELEWTSEEMVFSVDGVEHYTYNPATKDANTWPFDADQYLLLNIAIQSAIDPAFVSSAMEIDYVRVYQKEQEEPGPTEPAIAASIPTHDPADVISVFSDTYTDISPVDYNPNWGQATIATQVLIDGNNTLKYENLNYQGTDFPSIPQDLTTMNYVHLDYWTNSSEFSFFVIDATAGFSGGEPEEPRYKIAMTGGDETLVQGEWKSVFIPLQHFLDFDFGSYPYDLNDVGALKVEGNGTLFLDNIYFSIDNSLATTDFEISDFKAYPNPTQDVWTVKASNQNILSIQLFDILGKNVLSLTPNFGEAKIDGSGLTTGLYFAQIQTSSGIESVKLVKK